MIHLVNKKEGETPLAALERLCRDHGIYEKVTYAGRLDPMASGLLLVLSGDDVHKKDSMLEHTKTYEFTILLGVATDTGDILGKVTETVKADSNIASSESKSSGPRISSRHFSPSAKIVQPDHSDLLSASALAAIPEAKPKVGDKTVWPSPDSVHSKARRPEDLLETTFGVASVKIKKIIESFAKTYNQPYPLYSSKTVDGKPLWTYAREGTKPDVVPTHSVTISRCVLNSVETISSANLLEQIHARIEPVVGDFRQDEILKLWDESITAGTFVLLNCTSDVSSGTYIRQLAVDIGVKLGVPALAYNIHRTKVGNYSLKDALPEL